MSRDANKPIALVFSVVLALLAGCGTTGSMPSQQKQQATQVTGDLLTAVVANRDRQVLSLLSAGVAPDQPGASGETPLMLAAASGNRRIVRLLLAAGAKVNAVDKDGYSPVMHAAAQGHLSVVRALLAAGANVNVSQDGESLLMKVVGSGDLLTAEMLLAAGADVHYRGGQGVTALDIARTRGFQELEMLLRQAGAGR
ncbi:hypothetical protein C7H09_16080 [Marinobacter fuscus]|uniref:Uncharacterized protein n=1 Tax=Marinobacter fuscus TaxID=2109942 RepID=A0A2T1K4X5_9GAMM|nr:ankyrin repeat domain-containing protein [Marinobacter fuscus]PSF05120.1 hypothetical protein C7H09_16080 [Marinobacter fuscus]